MLPAHLRAEIVESLVHVLESLVYVLAEVIETIIYVLAQIVYTLAHTRCSKTPTCVMQCMTKPGSHYTTNARFSQFKLT